MTRYRLWFFIALMLLLSCSSSFSLAKQLTVETIISSNFAAGEEARYTIRFQVNEPLNLSTGAKITVEFPKGFDLIKNDTYAKNPGCTLANIQYKEPKDKHFALLEGTSEVKRSQSNTKFILQPMNGVVTIPANTSLYLNVPGVLNRAMAGSGTLKLTVIEPGGHTMDGASRLLIGSAPKEAPQNLRVTDVTSYKVGLAWNPTQSNVRYKVYCSTHPKGEYIEAVDFSREPAPGENWCTEEPLHSFAARGNGGLRPGQTYYFKVRAVNRFGAGPASQALAVTLPVVEVKYTQPKDREPAAVMGNDIIIKVDQPIKIAVTDKVRVYEKQTGIRVRDIRVCVDEADKEKIIIKVAFKPGVTYQVIFYEGALESQVAPRIVNTTLGWVFTTAGQRAGIINDKS